MAPVDRRRRRRRRLRPTATVGVLAGLAVVVLAVVAGGVLRMGSQSTAYWRDVDGSFAAGARPVVEQSNQLGGELRHVLGAMASETRGALEASLDTLVRAGDRLEEEAATASSPAPDGGAGAAFSAAMGDRALALRELRDVVDGLLGMAPLPAAGAAAPAPAAPATLSVAEASRRLEGVGDLLAAADRRYAAARRALHGAPGRATIPPSVWTGRTAAWTSGATRSLAASLAGAASLAPVHDVVLVTDAVALTPAPVPPASGPAAGEVLPPTGSLSLSSVVSNKGNVAERGVVLTASLASPGRPPVTKRSRAFSLGPSGSRSVSVAHLGVAPGRTYTLTVTVDPSVPDVAGAVTTDAVTFSVAPPSPPVVSQVLPRAGKSSGGTDVTILGTGFTWVRAVRFGSADARFKVVSSSRITAVAPAGTGAVAVTVVNSGGTSPAATTARYTYRRR